MAGLKGYISKNREHYIPHWAYVAVGTALYGSIWSYIGILKFLSLSAYVFDLGINSERGWQILHTNLGLLGYFTTLINSGIVFPLSPLTGSGNFFAMIIFQAFSIAIVGPAIYLISKEKGLKSRESMLLSFVFFLYFPVYGIMWFDFHYQVFFMPLFVFAYLLYLRKNYALSTLLFILSGIVRYPYSIFPLAFAILELINIIFLKQNTRDRSRIAQLIVLFVVMIFFTIAGYLIFGFSNTVPHSDISVYTNSQQSIFMRIGLIMLLTGPLLFTPLLRLRWLILSIPSFFLFLTSDYTWYLYPLVLQGQYISGVAPFLMIGMVEFLSNHTKKAKDDKFHIIKLKIKKHSVKLGKYASLIIVLLLVSNIFFSPFGPLNNYTNDNFNINQNLNYEPNRYIELSKMIKLIPSTNPYVAYQNNLPEVLPRPMPFNDTVLMGSYLGAFTNFSTEEAINNSWGINLANKKLYTPLDYAIADAVNPNFYLKNNSMYSLIQSMYSSGRYGILSEGDGLIALERNYSNQINYFIPEKINYFSQFGTQNTKSDMKQLSLSLDGIDNFKTESLQMSYLFPGVYNLTFVIIVKNISTNDYLNLSLISSSHSISDFNYTFHLNHNLLQNAVIRYTTLIAIDNVYGKLELVPTENSQGLNFVAGICIDQVAPFSNFS